MTVATKHHRPSPVEHVLVSQGSRRDAQEPSCSDKTYSEELAEVKSRLTYLNGELAKLGKNGLQKEQARIRRELGTGDRSFAEYMTIKASFQERRETIVGEKQRLESEVIRLKPLVASEETRKKQFSQLNRMQRSQDSAKSNSDLIRENGDVSYGAAALEIIALLEEIRDLLKSKSDT